MGLAGVLMQQVLRTQTQAGPAAQAGARLSPAEAELRAMKVSALKKRAKEECDDMSAKLMEACAAAGRRRGEKAAEMMAMI